MNESVTAYIAGLRERAKEFARMREENGNDETVAELNRWAVDAWQELMDRVVADYTPGQNFVPGSGTEGGDPSGIRYANLGPLAFVLNEAVDATVVRGADRDALLDAIAQAGGESVTRDQVDAVLAGKLKCPDLGLLQAFGNATSVDLGILLDAAQRGGCDGYFGRPTDPPGY